MDDKTAQDVLHILQSCSEEMNRTARMVNEACPEEEFKNYRRSIADVMGRLFLDVMRPIYLKHPGLIPDDLRPSLSKYLEQRSSTTDECAKTEGG